MLNLKYKTMKIAIIGTGIVAQTLSLRLFELGHYVMLGTRNVEDKKLSTTKDAYGNPSWSCWRPEAPPPTTRHVAS